MRARIKALAERALGVRILRELPPGCDVYHDLRRLPAWSPRGLLCDVGANVGQTTLALAAAFPEAPIWAFEPVPATFARLVEATAHLPQVRRFPFAVGAAAGSASMFLHRKPDQHTLRADLAGGRGFEAGHTVTVELRTLDGIVTAAGPSFVQYLKVDTEGYDLAVLKGATDTLRAGAVGALEVEAGFGQDEGKFVPLEEFRLFLRPLGYSLLGIYEQVQVRRHTRLRRCNAVFLHEAFAEGTAPPAPATSVTPA